MIWCHVCDQSGLHLSLNEVGTRRTGEGKWGPERRLSSRHESSFRCPVLLLPSLPRFPLPPPLSLLRPSPSHLPTPRILPRPLTCGKGTTLHGRPRKLSPGAKCGGHMCSYSGPTRWSSTRIELPTCSHDLSSPLTSPPLPLPLAAGSCCWCCWCCWCCCPCGCCWLLLALACCSNKNGKE